MMEFDVISALTGWCRRTHLSSNRTLSQELSTEIASHSLFLSIDHIPLDVGQGKRRRRKSDTEVENKNTSCRCNRIVLVGSSTLPMECASSRGY